MVALYDAKEAACDIVAMTSPVREQVCPTRMTVEWRGSHVPFHVFHLARLISPIALTPRNLNPFTKSHQCKALGHDPVHYPSRISLALVTYRSPRY